MLTGFVTGTVGRVLAQTGDPVPQLGRVEFTAEVDDHPAGDALIISDRVVCQLDAQGRILDPTDPEGTRLGVELDASEAIAGGFAYLVEIIGDSFDTRRFRIVVHANQTTDIATAVRVPAQPATVISTLQALIDTITGWISDPEFLRGAKGDEGDQGPAGVITDVTATALPPGSPPTVALSGTPEARTIALGIPAGAKGDIGDVTPKAEQVLADAVQARDDARGAAGDAQGSAGEASESERLAGQHAQAAQSVLDQVPALATTAGSQAAVQTLADQPEVVTAAAELAQSDAGLARSTEGEDWRWGLAYSGTKEVAIGEREDGTHYPPALDIDPEGLSRVEQGDTGWDWALVYPDTREVAVGRRADGSMYPEQWAAQKVITRCVIVGDSLSANWGQNLSSLRSSTGLQWESIGIGGQTPPQILARYGSEPLMVTVQGGVIPASGAVTVTLPDRLRSDTTNTTAVSICGIPGTFITTDSADYLAGTFTRAESGPEWPAPSQVPMVTGLDYRDRWPIIWVGRNGFKIVGDPGVYVGMIQRALDWMSADAREHCLVFSIPPWVGEEIGTSTRDKLNAQNAAYRSAFPAQWVDIAALMSTPQAVELAGLTPTEQDVTDIANGITPQSLRNVGDGGHFNAAAYTAINKIVAAEYASRGWI